MFVVCEQLPGSNLSPIVTKRGHRKRADWILEGQGKRSRSVGRYALYWAFYIL